MTPDDQRSASAKTLARTCKVLGLVDGCLLPATSGPTSDNENEWTDKGDWLKLAHSLKADSVFFVENEPVLVLANLPEGESEAVFFNRIWCCRWRGRAAVIGRRLPFGNLPIH